MKKIPKAYHRVDEDNEMWFCPYCEWMIDMDLYQGRCTVCFRKVEIDEYEGL